VNSIKAASLLVFAMIGLAAPSALSQSGTPQNIYRRVVPRDAETTVGQLSSYRTYGGDQPCSTLAIPALTLTMPPQHGTVRFGTADFIPYHSGCRNAVTGAVVFYRPNPGFVGRDRFTYNRPLDPNAYIKTGQFGLITVIVIVR
jgi:hypothetical protein